jgi:hypothetical protein
LIRKQKECYSCDDDDDDNDDDDDDNNNNNKSGREQVEIIIRAVNIFNDPECS